MRKKYTLLNSSFDIEGPEYLFQYLDEALVLFPTYTKKIGDYTITYELDPELYNDVLNDLKDQKKEIVRIYGEEFKTRIENKDIIFIYDDNSIIVHTDMKFMIIGKNDLSKKHVLDLIREAIYEGFLLGNDLLLKGGALTTNQENSSVLLGTNKILLKELLLGLPGKYIASDIVGVHNNRAIASINPIQLEENTYLLNEFLRKYSLNTGSNINIQNLVFSHFSDNGTFGIKKINKKDVKKLIVEYILSYGNRIRPYLWVNEIKLSEINRKYFETKLNNLIANTDSFHIEYGPSISRDNLNEMRKVLKI